MSYRPLWSTSKPDRLILTGGERCGPALPGWTDEPNIALQTYVGWPLASAKAGPHISSRGNEGISVLLVAGIRNPATGMFRRADLAAVSNEITDGWEETDLVEAMDD